MSGMLKGRLTKRVVDGLEAAEKRYIFWDSDIKGFGVRIEATGTKTYFVRYRAEGGGRRAPQRLLVLGRHGVLTTEAARRHAKGALAAVTRGEDPGVSRSKRRKDLTVEDLLDRYLTEHVSVHNKPSTAREARRHVETNIKPHFGRLRLTDLKLSLIHI